MTRKFPLLGLLRPAVVALATSAAMTLAVSSTAWAQRGHQPPSSSGGGQSSGSGGGAQASGGGKTSDAAPAPAPPPQAGHDRAQSGDSGRSGHAAPRGGSSSGGGAKSGGGTPGGAVTRDSSGSGDTSGSGSTSTPLRPRDGRPARGQAVERRPNSPGGGTTVIVTDGGYGGYYPWGYGGLGFGGYYGAGYYDPWWYDGYGSDNYGYGYEGALKLKVKPREASVYLDGYFAGRVDDFDGLFQRLRVESGPHRVEIRLDGYETLTFEVRIQPDRTLTYSGELKKLP